MIIKGKGFTLIELIVVVVLLSILGALGIGLFSSPSRFTPALSSELWINQIRFSQRLSFLKSNLNAPLSLSISRTSTDWLFVLSQDGITLDEYNIEHEGNVLRSSNVNFSSSCSTLSAVTYPLQFQFDGLGRVMNASSVLITSNQRFCLGDNDAAQFCLSPSGFAYGGTCVP